MALPSCFMNGSNIYSAILQALKANKNYNLWHPHHDIMFAVISCVWVQCSLPLLPAQYIVQMFTKINVAPQNLLYMCKNVHLTSVTNIKVLLMYHPKWPSRPGKCPQSNWTKGAICATLTWHWFALDSFTAYILAYVIV